MCPPVYSWWALLTWLNFINVAAHAQVILFVQETLKYVWKCSVALLQRLLCEKTMKEKIIDE